MCWYISGSTNQHGWIPHTLAADLCEPATAFRFARSSARYGAAAGVGRDGIHRAARAAQGLGRSLISQFTYPGSRGCAVLEPLEPRVLLSGDPWVFTAEDSFDLTLRIDGEGDGATVELIDPSSNIVASQGLAQTSEVRIVGSDGPDTLRIDLSALDGLPVYFEGGLGDDALHGPQTDLTWDVTGDDTGSVANVSFTGVENLIRCPRQRRYICV